MRIQTTDPLINGQMLIGQAILLNWNYYNTNASHPFKTTLLQSFQLRP